MSILGYALGQVDEDVLEPGNLGSFAANTYDLSRVSSSHWILDRDWAYRAADVGRIAAVSLLALLAAHERCGQTVSGVLDLKI